MQDYTIVMDARRFSKNSVRSTEGLIIKYDGELFFIHDGDCELDGFWMTIERHWCYEEIDADDDFYTYSTMEWKPIDIKSLKKEM